MNGEIKEIIELINTNYEDYYIDDFLSGEDVKKLVDYITNLQERIDKAIEYIVDYNLANSIILKRSYADLLKILQGGRND